LIKHSKRGMLRAPEIYAFYRSLFMTFITTSPLLTKERTSRIGAIVTLQIVWLNINFFICKLVGGEGLTQTRRIVTSCCDEFV